MTGDIDGAILIVENGRDQKQGLQEVKENSEPGLEMKTRRCK
jgi:hypothetical protein